MSSIEIKTVCVLGGCGFVGSHVVAKALEKGWKVHVTTRDPSDQAKLEWMSKIPNAEGNLKFFGGSLEERGSYDEALKGCEGAVVCALPEVPSNPKLVEVVTAGVENVLASCTRQGVNSVVITSSGGSTNPRDGDPPIKRETEHFSDPEWQMANRKYSVAAKTLMERLAFKHAEEHPEMKVAILLPNMIVGPMFQPEIGNSLLFLLKIAKGGEKRPPDASVTDASGSVSLKNVLRWNEGDTLERFKKVPNGSMSVIDVRDLAELELAALANPKATGRYFGVLKSFHWKDILESINRAHPSYSVPELGYKEGEEVRPTQFDLTRRDSLGVNLRSLDETIIHTMQHLRDRSLLD